MKLFNMEKHFTLKEIINIIDEYTIKNDIISETNIILGLKLLFSKYNNKEIITSENKSKLKFKFINLKQLDNNNIVNAVVFDNTSNLEKLTSYIKFYTNIDFHKINDSVLIFNNITLADIFNIFKKYIFSLGEWHDDIWYKIVRQEIIEVTKNISTRSDPQYSDSYKEFKKTDAVYWKKYEDGDNIEMLYNLELKYNILYEL